MYFPKSEIEINLYTYGNEFKIINSEKSYVGYYFKTSSGKYYTNSQPSPTSIELEKYIQEDDIKTGQKISNIIYNSYNNNDIDLYNNSKKNIIKRKIIPTYLPNIPTELDYNKGEFIRYFCKKRNENIYIEINLDIYNLLTKKDNNIMWELYFPFLINWKISGDKNKIYNINKNIVLLKINTFKLIGFNIYLKEDYLRFYK
jgi:hypothetical protein